jgi:hypothetical protein
MTFTWVEDAAITTDLQKVRIELGDTDATDQLLQDEEINYFLGDTSTVLMAAARAADAIARKFARDFNWEADGQRVAKGDRAKEYRTLAQDLRKRSAGGITVAQTRHDDGWQRNLGVDHRDVEATGASQVLGPDWP